MSIAKRVSEDRARFGSHRAHSAGSFALALDDLAAPVRRWRRPGDDQDALLIVTRHPLGKLDLDCRSRDDDALDGGA
jgi:inactivated superfamily I helicase